MRQIRVLIGKAGLDGHDRGALVIAQALRDHGMEVIYTGLRQSPQQIAQAAIQEDVDVVGLSSLSGAHRSLFPKVVEALKERKADDIPVIGGGVIPADDIPFLLERGVKKIFTSGTSTDSLAEYIKQLVGNGEAVAEPPSKIAHIGIAVHDIEQAIPFYHDLLGLPLEKVEEVPSEQVKVAFLKIGESRIELLEPMNEQSSIHRFLDKKGEGIHHIAFEVDNLEKRLAHLKKQGIDVLNETPVVGAGGSQIAFLHPKAANRVLIELSQHSDRRDD
ncbi:methylmalonyl-CoA epimerase [Sediminibacillus albus]|uniref:Methylmalonyl-CoA mutase, C-terminal domain n=1 Tax=Sediminibacillus albus TaxID=407036 RepID=A0A1G8VGZ8_9BACI|nr:methylmalonyl-CoA epimerase [Sediminibacillus albus]SDJ65293.1 methylmalonyl-CoA mutase, C-terminal domain [Sediminibacillus albus]